MQDLIDRQATVWHRIWIIFSGLWLVGVASHLPGTVGLVVGAIAWTMVAAAAGLVELAMALWYRYLHLPVRDGFAGLAIRIAAARTAR